jgi:hypothetical protein
MIRRKIYESVKTKRKYKQKSTLTAGHLGVNLPTVLLAPYSPQRGVRTVCCPELHFSRDVRGSHLALLTRSMLYQQLVTTQLCATIEGAYEAGSCGLMWPMEGECHSDAF